LVSTQAAGDDSAVSAVRAKIMVIMAFSFMMVWLFACCL
jgi:hypothetical protein